MSAQHTRAAIARENERLARERQAELQRWVEDRARFLAQEQRRAEEARRQAEAQARALAEQQRRAEEARRQTRQREASDVQKTLDGADLVRSRLAGAVNVEASQIAIPAKPGPNASREELERFIKEAGAAIARIHTDTQQINETVSIREMLQTWKPTVAGGNEPDPALLNDNPPDTAKLKKDIDKTLAAMPATVTMDEAKTIDEAVRATLAQTDAGNATHALNDLKLRVTAVTKASRQRALKQQELASRRNELVGLRNELMGLKGADIEALKIELDGYIDGVREPPPTLPGRVRAAAALATSRANDEHIEETIKEGLASLGYTVTSGFKTYETGGVHYVDLPLSSPYAQTHALKVEAMRDGEYDFEIVRRKGQSSSAADKKAEMEWCDSGYAKLDEFVRKKGVVFTDPKIRPPGRRELQVMEDDASETKATEATQKKQTSAPPAKPAERKLP